MSYPALSSTKTEPEYKVNPSLEISSIGTEIKSNNSSMPYGAALLTDSGCLTSGLKSQGINYIIHATPMPEGSSLETFVAMAAKSIQNSINLAERKSIVKLATCFLGGNIYCNNESSKLPLAKGIVRAALNQLEKCSSLQELIFVDFDGDYYLNAWNEISAEPDCPLTISKTRRVKGNLCQKSTHGAEAIVNSENTGMNWGGGISGAIKLALGNEASNVDQQRKKLMKSFNNIITNGKQDEEEKNDDNDSKNKHPNQNDNPESDNSENEDQPGKDKNKPTDSQKPTTPGKKNGNGNGNDQNPNDKDRERNEENNNKDQKPDEWRTILKTVDSSLEQAFNDTKISEWKQEKGSLNNPNEIKILLEIVIRGDNKNNFLAKIKSEHSVDSLENLITNKSPQQVITIVKRFEYDNLSLSEKETKNKKMRKHYKLGENFPLSDNQINEFIYKEATGETKESSSNEKEQDSNNTKTLKSNILKYFGISALILMPLGLLLIIFIWKRKKIR